MRLIPAGLVMLTALTGNAFAEEAKKFSPEQAAHCFAISAITADMILPVDDPMIRIKELGAERAPLWEYELNRSVDGDEEEASRYKEKSLEAANSNFRDEDGKVKIFLISAYVNTCNSKMNEAYPEGHPLLNQ